MKRSLLSLTIFCSVVIAPVFAQQDTFTRADTLRGSVTPERAWWNVLRYDLAFAPDFSSKTVAGRQVITFNVLDTGRVMQIDLQEPMTLDAAAFRSDPVDFSRDGDVWYIRLTAPLSRGDTAEVTLNFSGKPRAAVQPPWDGGWVWSRDDLGRTWAGVACQGIGASVWFPCKDHQSDEPDLGASISVTVPDTLTAVSNGRLIGVEDVDEGLRGYAWEVVSPINTYNMTVYIGNYVRWSETFEGEEGTLDLDFYVLDYEKERAEPHFAQVHGMLACFEDWFGPYPFYADGYKLVQSPYLGMEHQSAIAYGNRFKNGYMGMDLSGSGWGLKWDFIIVHESGHEWFGNNITSADIADMWIHEGFTAYSEALYVECNYGKDAGADYIAGTRRNVMNDRPVIGPYGVNKEGSGDMYFKAANMIHMIRTVMDNDSLFRAMLREMNRKWYHGITTSAETEAFINDFSGKDFTGIFDQYLRRTEIPVLEYTVYEGKLYYRYRETAEEFDLEIPLTDGTRLKPGPQWQSLAWDKDPAEPVRIDRNYYVFTRALIGPPVED